MAGIPWANEEIEVLELFYGDTRMETLVELLPGRSPKSISTKAHFLGLKRNKDFMSKLKKETFDISKLISWKEYRDSHKKYLPILKEHYQYLMKLFYGR